MTIYNIRGICQFRKNLANCVRRPFFKGILVYLHYIRNMYDTLDDEHFTILQLPILVLTTDKYLPFRVKTLKETTLDFLHLSSSNTLKKSYGKHERIN